LDFFLIDGKVPILKKAKMMRINPNTKSNTPIGREITSLILNLFCGISGAMNKECSRQFLFGRKMRPNKKPHKLIDNIAIAKKLIITVLSHKHFIVTHLRPPYYRCTKNDCVTKKMSLKWYIIK
jgi:hypothetical protein